MLNRKIRYILLVIAILLLVVREVTNAIEPVI
ncbi:MAG: hypothetical protein Ta2B_11100 [Termitinemataceae bacterium]|nr:MAG: hypothetical protein Ta2B_11100 [Termitinemataceae bacterium]